VILEPYTIVHEGAMVVKTLNTLVAVIAMHRVLRSQVFTVYANVVKMQFFINKTFHKPQEVFF